MVTKARGCITVLDRAQFEERTCECYVAVTEECERMMSPLKTAH